MSRQPRPADRGGASRPLAAAGRRPGLPDPARHARARGLRAARRAAAHRTGDRGRTRPRSSAPSSRSTSRCPSTPAGSACWPATSSRRRRTWACRWSASASCTGTATSASASTRPAGSTSTGSRPILTACPAALVTGDDGLPVTVTVPIADREVVAQIWRVDVGRVPLLLLDCNREENHLTDRWITSRLYVGDPGMRLGQYAVLGIGGVRALEALGVDPGVVHLNEGHAAMACLELVRAESGGDARRCVRGRPAQDRVHDAHAGSRGQRHVSGRADGRDAGRHRVRDGLRPVSARAPRPHAHGRGRRAVRRHAVRAALEPDRQRREQTPRRGRARDVAATCGRSATSTTSRSRT